METDSERVAEAYSEYASVYDAGCDTDSLGDHYRIGYESVEEFMKSADTRDIKTVADIGCGTGLQGHEGGDGKTVQG